MQAARRVARTSLAMAGLAMAAFSLACTNDVTGPDPGAEERGLVRQIEASGTAECLAEYQRVIPLLPSMTPLQRIAEIRRILALCRAGGSSTGSIFVQTVTTGDDIDSDGYSVTVDGTGGSSIGVNDDLTITGVASGTHQVALTGVAGNCTVAGDNPRSVDVPSGGTVGTGIFSVTCEAAPPTGAEGVIAFISNASGSAEIWIMNDDGSNPTRLTTNGNNERHVALSPNGTKIAFASNSGGDLEIWVMNVDGTGATALTSNTVIDQDPTWSHDGSKIVFEREVSGVFQVFVMNADGSGATQLTTGTRDRGSPSFSPDDSQIVFTVGSGGDFELSVMNDDGSSPTEITTSGGVKQDPAWAVTPDGEKIAFEKDGEVWLVDPDGSDETQITDSATDSSADPVWAPDGLMLAIERGTSSAHDIFILSSNGSGLVNLTNSVADETDPSWGPAAN